MRLRLVTGVILSFLIISTSVAGEGESLDTFAYQSGVTIVNDSGSTLTNAPIAISAQPANLIAQGYMQSDAEDSRMSTQAGAELRHVAQGMTSDDVAWWVQVPSLADGSSITHVFHTGNSTATRDQGFLLDGSGDTITATDHADLDITTRLFTQAGFNVQSWPTSEAYVVRKQDAYEISLDDPGGVETVYGRVYASATATLLPNATGDFENIANESGCASGSHWDCLQSNDGITSRVLEVDALPDNTLQDAVNVGDFSPTGVSIMDVDIVCDVEGIPGSWKVGVRLSGTTGTLQSTTPGNDCSDVDDFARPGGGSWTASDLDSVQLVVEITEFNDTAANLAFYYAAIVVTYVDSTELSVTTDETGTDLAVDTEYTVFLTADGTALELTVLETATSEGGGSDGFASATFDSTIYSTANDFIVRTDVDGYVNDVSVGSLTNQVKNASYESTDFTDWNSVNSGSHSVSANARSTTQAKFGNANVLIDITNTSSGGSGANTTYDTGRRQDIAAAPTEIWSISAWGHITAISGSTMRARLIYEWLDSGLSRIGDLNASNLTTAGETTSDFTRIILDNKTAPANTAWLRVWVTAHTDAGSSGDSITLYWDGVMVIKASASEAWKDSIDVLDWEFEPDDLEQTQEGNNGNSWTWLGTVEDVSTGGSDHDGIYSLTRDMSGITRYFNGLQIKSLQDATVAEDVRNTLGTSGIDPTNTQSAAQFPFRAEIEVGLDQLPITSEAAWFILVSALGFAIAAWAWTRSVNELLGTIPLVLFYWIGWTLGLYGLFIVVIASIVCLAAAGGVRRFSQGA